MPTSRSANLAARWARALVRRSPRSGRAASLLFAVVLVGWLGLTGYGTFLASRPTGFADAIADAFYGPFTFLAPQDGYRTAATDLSNDALRVGRFFGAALPVLTLLWAGLHLMRLSIARGLVARFAAGHVVIVSHGGAADMLARQTAAQGEAVLLIEDDIAPARAAGLASEGVIVLTPAASLAVSLANARAAHAAHVVAWSAGDAMSVADAIAAAEEIRHGEIVVHAETAETQRALRHAPSLLEGGGVRLRPLSPGFAAMRGALGGADLVAEALAMGRDHVAVALHGGSTALQAAAQIVLRQNWSIHLGPPALRHDAGQAWRQWRRHHASFLDHADAVFEPGARPVLGEGTDEAAITRHIVDLEDDDATLAYAFDLAARLAQRMAAPPRVQPVLRGGDAARALVVQAETLAFAEPILLDRARPLAALLARDEDEVAAALHLDYAARFGGGAAGGDWRLLPETYVHASRAAADHRSVKYLDLARAREAGMAEDEIVARMTRVEHLRWSAERLLDGWAPGPRDNGRRLHNNLLPWAALDETDRDKDRQQVLLAVAVAG